jgi:dihydroneopterin triphosphate diphosphatase
MVRAPFNVLVVPFIRQSGSRALYCVLRRADEGWWQWISGGGESDETPVEAALRETAEETGINGHLFPLNSQARVPVSAFAARALWPRDLYVIPEYHFAVEASSVAVTLSREHSEMRWAGYEEAYDLLRWQSNQIALWELSERLQKDDLPS